MGPHASGELRIGEAARRLGRSVDTLRRWERAGKLRTVRDDNGQRLIPRAEVDRLLRRVAPARHTAPPNRLAGIVRSIETDGVMAIVEIAAGPYAVAAVLSCAALAELDLAIGTPVTAVLDATAVLVQTDAGAE
jgi:molybdopterin-binding protein